MDGTRFSRLKIMKNILYISFIGLLFVPWPAAGASAGGAQDQKAASSSQTENISAKDGKYRINPASVKIKAVKIPEAELKALKSNDSFVKLRVKEGQTAAVKKGGRSAIDVANDIVNLVDKVIDIIKEGQPVVDVDVNYANAVPSGIDCWTDLQGWSDPQIERYSLTMENLYGMKVVDVVYQVHYIFGGNYYGTGQYLTGVTVEPISVDVMWGYNLDMTAVVPDSTIVNVGSSDDPVAAMQLQLKWKVHNPIEDRQGKYIYYMRGDGVFQDLSD